jgi:copper chaperone CopZ
MTETKSISIEGMTCANCIRHVSDALSGIEGVALKEVGMGTARIEHDPAQAPEAKIIEAVREAGYPARIDQ